MKTYLKLSIMILFGLLLFSCANQYPTTDHKTREKDYSVYSSLADVLRREPGLTVMGAGNNIRVYMRGISTIKLETQPLYVIDGVPIGNSYARANNAVIPSNIASIKILKDTSQLTLYGEQGNNGVIVIKTKTGEKEPDPQAEN